MAKYNWKQLEKEYLLSEYNNKSDFFKNKGIEYNAYIRRSTKEWKGKKLHLSHKKVTKTIEKVIEKESEKEAQQIVDIKSIANDLALNVIKANKELNNHIAKNKKKTKVVKYDYKTNKPSKEVIDETEEVTSYISIIDRQGLKMLTSALKDLNDILIDKQENTKVDLNNAKEVLVKIREVADNDRT